MLAASSDDTIRLIITSDIQRAYKEAKELVRTVNNMPGIDFVLMDGDISEYGLLMEMESINDIMARLHVPYITVIGNHDFVGKGETVYQRMFGELNFSFIYKGVKFICHNNNSREFNFDKSVPDLDWLRKEFSPQEGVQAYIAVGHVPPFSSDFNLSLTNEYIEIINGSPYTLAAFFAHDHRFDLQYPHNQEIPYFTTNAAGNREFLLIEIINGTLNYKNIGF